MPARSGPSRAPANGLLPLLLLEAGGHGANVGIYGRQQDGPERIQASESCGSVRASGCAPRLPLRPAHDVRQERRKRADGLVERGAGAARTVLQRLGVEPGHEAVDADADDGVRRRPRAVAARGWASVAARAAASPISTSARSSTRCAVAQRTGQRAGAARTRPARPLRERRSSPSRLRSSSSMPVSMARRRRCSSIRRHRVAAPVMRGAFSRRPRGIARPGPA